MLMLVGGGEVPESIRGVVLDRAGPGAEVAILPLASRLPDRGDWEIAPWRDAGSDRVWLIDPQRQVLDWKSPKPPTARSLIDRAKVIWMPGGWQCHLMAQLTAFGLLEPVLAAHRAGAILAGTSAGAAVMPEHMAVSDREQAQGLGVYRGRVIEQHFDRVQEGRTPRLDRLIDQVLARPHLLGVGIDEGTGVWVEGGRETVVGQGTVTTVDLRKLANPSGLSRKEIKARHVRVFRAGDTLPA